MTPFLVYYDESVMSGFRLKAELTGHSLAYHFRLAAQQYLSGSNLAAGILLSGGGVCSGSVLSIQIGG
jgi:hypothetical protein